MASLNKQLFSRLADILGERHVITDDDARRNYGQDWTRFFSPSPCGVVFPTSTEQVRDLVLLARQERLPLVPSGGRTGLSGGAVAEQGELVVSFDKMNVIGNLDETDETLVVGAGVITAQLQDFAASKGLMYPVDFASSGSSQMGGNIATNAGGIRVLRYGLSRDWIAGLKVVTGAGEILDMNKGLVKNATGYDLRHLFIGSEGTLGFVTEATIRLTQPPKGLTVAFLAVPQMVDVISVMAAFRREVTLTAFEFLSHLALEHVVGQGNRERPFAKPCDYYVLLEFETNAATDLTAAEAAFATCVDKGWVVDGLLSQSEAQRLDLWKYREHISEAITPRTPYKNDVSVKPSAVPACLERVEQAVTAAYPDFEIVWFGHIGDGNLHLNILKPESMAAADFKRQCEGVNSQVMEVIAQLGGSISAEHGVGLLKKSQLHFTRSKEEIQIMHALKAVFDPDGIMNPGKLLPIA